VDKTAWRRDKEEEEEEEEEDSSSDEALHLMMDVFLVRLMEDWTCARKSRKMERTRERESVSATKKRGRAVQRAFVHRKKRDLTHNKTSLDPREDKNKGERIQKIT